MKDRWDILVAGGSVAGLLAAREASKLGAEVLVIEEDLEIGTPEKCGGLVSLSGLRELEVEPPNGTVRITVEQARFNSPSGHELVVPSKKQSVVVLERRKFDRYLAEQAFDNGTTISTGERLVGFVNRNGDVKVTTNRGSYRAKLLIDARGGHAMIETNREGVLQSAQYEIIADWVKPAAVEVFIDQEKTPGFFSWVIPLGVRTARIGAAGRGVNGFQILDEWIRKKGGSVLKKVAAPIVVGGPLNSFTEGRLIRVGDAAGQSKPTTAGGIYTSGFGGLLAGRQAGLFIREGDFSILQGYERGWRQKFEEEFRLMKLARGVFENMDNDAIDKLFTSLDRESLQIVAENMFAFDRHSEALKILLKPKTILKLSTGMKSHAAQAIIQLVRLLIKG